MIEFTFLRDMDYADLQRSMMEHHDDETQVQLESEIIRRNYDIEHDITYC
jgi:hypothetical protein